MEYNHAVEGFEGDLNRILIICPKKLQREILRRVELLGVHLSTKEEVEHILRGMVDPLDELVWASRKNMKLAAARAELNLFALMLDEPKEKVELKPVAELFKKRKEAKKLGLVSPDTIQTRILKGRKVYVVGYTEEVDTDLFKVLREAGVEFDTKKLEEFVPNYSDDSMDINVTLYDYVWQECLVSLNKIAELLKNGTSPSDIEILCPSDYAFTLSQTSSLLGIVLNAPSSTSDHALTLEDFFKADDYTDQALDGLVESLNKSVRLHGLVESINNARSLIREYEDPKARRGKLIESLRKELIKESLSKPMTSNPDREGIEVVNSLSNVKPGKRLFVLGFSDSLSPTARDTGIIPDELRDICTLAQTAVERNAAMEDDLRLALSLASDTPVLSRSRKSEEKDYIKPFFTNDDRRFNYRETKFLDGNRVFKSYGLKGKSGLPRDLELVYSLAVDAFCRKGDRRPEAAGIFKLSKSSADPSKGLNIYDTYDPEFDYDDKTVERFKEINAEHIAKNQGEDSGFSYSAIETYLENPFKYYCSYILNIKSPTSFPTALGHILHRAAERTQEDEAKVEGTKGDETQDQGTQGQEFDLKKAIDEEEESIDFSTFEMSKEIFEFNVRFGYENFKDYVQGGLKDTLNVLNAEIVRPEDGRDEFSPKGMHIYGDLTMQASYDAVLRLDDNDSMIVDFKSAKGSQRSSYSNYFKALLAETGRKTQLLVYLMTFPKAREKFDQLQDLDDPKGAFLCALLNRGFDPKFQAPGSLYGVQTELGDTTVKENLNTTFFAPVSGKDAEPIIPSEWKIEAPDGDTIYPLRARCRMIIKKIPAFCLRFGITSDDDTKDFLPFGFYSLPKRKDLKLSLAQYLMLVTFMTDLQFTWNLRNGRLRADEGKGNPIFFPFYPAENDPYDPYTDISYRSSGRFNRELSKRVKTAVDPDAKNISNDFVDFDDISPIRPAAVDSEFKHFDVSADQDDDDADQEEGESNDD